MPYIDSNAGKQTIKIYYEDLGEGKPILLIHGWPLSGSMWEYQVPDLIKKGFRCITYDRRGFGRSDYPADGYDYETLAGDLKALIDALNVDDITLVGFSMGGGEIAKYFANHGGNKVSKVILISAVTPYMLQTDDNPDGVPVDVFAEIEAGIKTDRPGFLENFNKDFYSVGLLNTAISEGYLANSSVRGMDASPIATLGCARAFATTDFRKDMPKINVPALIIHGDKDKIVPIKATSEQSLKLIPDARLLVYEGEPHGLWFTQKVRLTEDIAAFAG